LVITPLYWHLNQGKSSSNILFPLYFSKKDSLQKNKVLFPLVWSFQNERNKTFTLIPFYSKGNSLDQRNKYLMISPMYWKFSSESAKNNLLFPFYYSRKEYYPNDTADLKTVCGIYWHYWNNSVNNKVIFPLFVGLKNEKFKSNTFLPFYSKGGTNNYSSSYLMVNMLYWQFKSTNQSSKIFFPVYFCQKKYYENDTTSFKTIFPVYWTISDKLRNNKVIFPFAWSLKNGNYKSFTLLPLFSRGISNINNSNYLMLSMIYWNFESSNQKNKLLFPVYFSHKKYYENDTALFKTIFPVYWSYTDNEKNIRMFTPLSWSLKNSYYKSLTLLPFYSGGHSMDMKRKYMMLASIYWQFDKPGSNKKAFLPIYFSSKKYEDNDTSIFKTIFPIYWASKDNLSNNKVFFPLIWNLKNANYESHTFLPFYSKGQSTIDGSEYKMVSMLYWQFNSANQVIKTLFPLYLSQKKYDENDTSIFKILFPVYWANKDNSKNNKVVFPISWSLKNDKYKSYTFFPFYSKGHSLRDGSNHLVVSMLYWQFNSADQNSKIIFPFYWSEKIFYENDTSVFKAILPLYWANKDKSRNNKIFVPIIWSFKNQNYESFTILPLFSKRLSTRDSSAYKMFSMIYWQFNSKYQKTRTLIPIYFSQNKYLKNDTATIKTIFPFYWSNKSHSEDNKVVFPLFWSFKNEDHKSFTFFPIYSKGINFNSKNYLAITPIFWQFKGDEDKKTVIFPIYSQYKNMNEDKKSNLLYFIMRHDKTDKRNSTQILWPICESTHDNEYKYFRFAPIVWYKKTRDIKFFSIQPIYYVSKTSEFENHHIFWQLYASKNQFGYKKSQTVLWKLFYKDTYENSDYETRFLYLAYANVKKEGKVEKSYFPFCYRSSDDEGNKSFAVFFYFYNKFQRRIGESNDFYREEKIFWFLRLRSNYRALKKEGKIESRFSS
jgi:hypothetical protein